MTPEVRVISIGALAAHPLWNERTPARTGHATTTLITAGDRRILVDPSLPAQALVARLRERANVGPEQITDVFLTCFKPDVRRAIQAFEDASWWIAEAERESVGVALLQRAQEADDAGDAELRDALALDVAIMRRCAAAPDALAERVDLFPLPGVTPGMSGLLVAHPRHTLLICGDAVPTVEHLERGAVLPSAADVSLAQESFREAIEIADLIVPGRDNLVVNPARRPF